MFSAYILYPPSAAWDTLSSKGNSDMPKKNKQPGGDSLAGQINRYWALRSLGNFLIMDIIMSLLLTAGWCYSKEKEAGSIILDIRRQLTFGTITADPSKIFGGAEYIFGGRSVSAEFFLRSALYVGMIVLTIQIISVICGAVSGAKRARKLLRPLNELADSANVIVSAPIDIPTEAKSEAEADAEPMDLTGLRSAIDSADPIGSAHIHTGNSDLKVIEDAVNSLLDRMRESYIRQAQFVNDASHELRTPIAVIKGYTDMLSRWGKSDEKVLDESITALKNESDHINRLVEQLLFLARGDNGKQVINKDVFSLSDVIKDVCSEYRLIDETHAYLADIQGDFKAYGDISLIKQTARILTDNAKKYTPAGGEITLRVRRNVQGEVCFEVQDTGIGMEQSDIKHIFERFYRADPARSRDTGGTGLGLSIAKWIVDRHGGRFDISSCVGIGTRIAVILPKINPESADFMLNDEKAPSRSMSIIMRK